MKSEAARAARAIASECLAVRIRRLGRVITRIYDGELERHGVGIAQLNLLVAIAMAERVRPADLTRMLDVEKSTLSRDLRRMAKMGWIEIGPADSGRGQSVKLTRAGIRLLIAVRPAWRRAQRKARSELSQGRLEQLRRLL